MADIKFVEDRVEMEGTVISTGSFIARGGLTCPSGEVRSSGDLSGYSFVDRQVKAFLPPPDVNFRFVWYASSQKARLWSGNDMVTISWDVPERQIARLSVTNGTVAATRVECAALALKGADMGATIAALQARLKVLEAKLGVVPPPDPGGGNGRPPPRG